MRPTAERKVLLWLLVVWAVAVVLMVALKHMMRNVSADAPLDLQETQHRYSVDCAAIYSQDPVETGRALDLKNEVVVEEGDGSLVNLTSNCDRFLESRGYRDVCVTPEEANFPLAYSLVVHKKAWMVERLIRALYSPSNVFCIHYDVKSSEEFRSAMEGLAQCLPNVFVSTKREYVVYASINRLKADLHCVSDLLQSHVQWRYVINLCGQDFPLRTNVELVSELTRLKGGNMLETRRATKAKRARYEYQHILQNDKLEYFQMPLRTNRPKEPPPHGIEMFTGSAYFVLSRKFVEFMESSDVVRDFLAWSEDTYSPDEHFWGTLARLPGAPGQVPGAAPDITGLDSKTRLVKWSYREGEAYPPCTGIHVRAICIFGLGELRWLLNYGHWFANKFDTKVDPIIIQCLEENLQKKQRFLQSLTSPVCQRRFSSGT